MRRTGNYLIANRDDRRRFFAPSAAYSPTEDWDWTAEVEFVRGTAGSEDGRYNDVSYTSVQRFF